MSRIIFDPEQIKRGIATAKIVKPATGDFVLKVTSEGLVIWSSDRRRSCRVIVPSTSDSIPSNDEFFLPIDRTSLFDTELASISLLANDKGLSIKTEGDGQSRSANVKRRADNSRRAGMPSPLKIGDFPEFDPSHLDDLLRQASCSALVKETKTEEDMKINQVHFYSESGHVFSTARYYATLVHMEGLPLDLSIVSADIPSLRSFCAKASGKVALGQDSNRLFLVDSSTNSYLAFNKVSTSKPKLAIPPTDGYKVTIIADRETLKRTLKWSSMALEGTQRLSLKTGSDSIKFLAGNSEVSSMPASVSGEMNADFPSRVLSTIVEYMGDGSVKILFNNPASPGLLEVTQDTDSPVTSRHFVSSMRGRT